MIILRLALVSALIYVGFALAIEVALFVALLILAKIHGGSSIFISRPGGWFVFFGLLWFVSFWIAYRISPFFKLGPLPK